MHVSACCSILEHSMLIRLQSIVEASVADLQKVLTEGSVTSVELVAKYLIRIHTYDFSGPCLNSIVKLNPDVFAEAAASDRRRAAGQLRGLMDGIPYTIKDSMKYKGMTCASGSPAFANLVANEDSFVAERLREAGAVCIGRTNTPPMMASGMHRGLYGRAESPYNLEYLTAAFSSGSSNGSATSTAASFATFGLGSETVSSGRSPASNNALVAYTPSRTVISPRGVWPLYPTCDVLVPQTRSVSDMLALLDVIALEDTTTEGDFWRQQQYVAVPTVHRPASYTSLASKSQDSLHRKRLAVPKMFIGEHDATAKPTYVSPEVIALWWQARKDLESLGATVIETDFPLVADYEDDSTSGHTNNVVGFKPDWNGKERGELVAYLWDDFLKQNGDPYYPGLASVDGSKMFPRPAGYIPDKYMEHKNFMNYPGLVEIAKHRGGKSIWDIDGIAEALPALEAQRKRNLEDWMDHNGVDAIVFPANGDVGKADLDMNDDSARHALQNGVKYSNGNRALRHMGVPTVSVTMGLIKSKAMPVNLTFAGKHGQDCDLLRYAYLYEQATRQRVQPPVTPPLPTDSLRGLHTSKLKSDATPPRISVSVQELHGNALHIGGEVISEATGSTPSLQVFLNGQAVPEDVVSFDGMHFEVTHAVDLYNPPKPLYGGYSVHVGKANIVITVHDRHGVSGAVCSVGATA